MLPPLGASVAGWINPKISIRPIPTFRFEEVGSIPKQAPVSLFCVVSLNGRKSRKVCVMFGVCLLLSTAVVLLGALATQTAHRSRALIVQHAVT